jgi:hypothetical protein
MEKNDSSSFLVMICFFLERRRRTALHCINCKEEKGRDPWKYKTLQDTPQAHTQTSHTLTLNPEVTYNRLARDKLKHDQDSPPHNLLLRGRGNQKGNSFSQYLT